MTPSEIEKKRLQFLVRVVSQECKYLAVLASALQTGREFVSALLGVAAALVSTIDCRDWLRRTAANAGPA